MCDLRVYSYSLTVDEVLHISRYSDNVIDGLPDKYCEYANILDIPVSLIDMANIENDVVKITALEALYCY